ncbi:MOSC domain-containing protein [Pseudomonas aeruginosa]
MQQVIAVSLCATHAFSKQVRPAIRLLKGLGVEGDAHHGVTVKHRSRVRQDPTQPNLRQVHLIHEELHDELRASGFAIGPGTMGENITTRGVDLLGLPTGTRLRLGESALVELTGLRNPCSQLDNYQPGLTAAVLGRDEQGNLIRKAGVMAIVLEDGEVRPGDAIDIQLPPAAPGPGESLRRSAAIPGELCARACVPMLASTAQPQGVTACTSSHWRHCS